MGPAEVPKARDCRRAHNPLKVKERRLKAARTCTFKLRIVYIDFYLGEKIYPKFDASISPGNKQEDAVVNEGINLELLPKIQPESARFPHPIIRIHGRTPVGQSACLHVHEYYPYMFIPAPDDVTAETVSFLSLLKAGIEKQFRDSIHKMLFVVGTPFYGYHRDEKLFVKIELYDPQAVWAIANYLRSGNVLGQVFQPYESHVTYLMHFMSDYNLFGMDYIQIDQFTFRGRLPHGCSCPGSSCFHDKASFKVSTGDPDTMFWTSRNTDGKLVVLPQVVTDYNVEQFKDCESSLQYPNRQCPKSCDLELDAPAFAILNHLQRDSRRTSGKNRVIPSLEHWWHALSQYLKSTQICSLSPSQRPDESFYFDASSKMYSDYLKAWLYPGIQTEIKSIYEQTTKNQATAPDTKVAGDQTQERQSQSQLVASQEIIDIMDQWQRSLSQYKESSQSDYLSQTSSFRGPRYDTDDGYVSQEESDENDSDGNPDEQKIAETWQDIIDSQGDYAFKYDTEDEFEDSAYEDAETASKGENSSRIPQLDGLDSDTDTDTGVVESETNFHIRSPSRLRSTNASQSDSILPYFTPRERPPLSDSLVSSLVPEMEHDAAFFSNPVDFSINEKSAFRRSTERIRQADSNYTKPILRLKRKVDETWPSCLEPVSRPPHAVELYKTHGERIALTQSSVTSVSCKGKNGSFKLDSTMLETRVLCIEIFARSREGKHPDPSKDPVLCACLITFGAGVEEPVEEYFMSSGPELSAEDYEHKLFQGIISKFEEYDPDIVLAYEVQKSSLGYLFKRAHVLGLQGFVRQLSRPCFGPQDKRHGNDEWGEKEHSGFWIVGRIILNCWRIFRKEVNLTVDSLENVCYELLKLRIPKYEYSTMQKWYDTARERYRIPQHLFRRASATVQVMDHLDVVVRTSELCRFIGADFFSVLTRGSQFRVEAVMVRIATADPCNYLLPSASKAQVSKQPALDEVALTLEPRTRFYKDPVVVLDFRSLYPSVIIAYNLCYSTLVGKIVPDTKNPFRKRIGIFPDFARESKERIKQMYENNELYIAPNGTVFVKPCVRRGILPMMLEEILETRIRVKMAMKSTKKNKQYVSTRVLDARQFALKMIANVTYGYTSASLTGRMPCADLADTIVRIGRASLEDCIRKINRSSKDSPVLEEKRKHPNWQAQVVYGDTDSVFVHLPGRSLLSAFEIGRDIALKLSQNHPPPMKLQFEKVYLPSILAAKKRYCGAIFESEEEARRYLKLEKTSDKRDTLKIVLEAKGIEIVRRDSCPLVGHIMEDLLKILFKTKDLSLVRACFDKYTQNIMANRISVKEFVTASKVRLSLQSESHQLNSSYRSALPPSSAKIALQRFRNDPMDYPLYKQRIPFIIQSGLSNMRKYDLVCEPKFDSRINAKYYIEKRIIPPLVRLFSIVGVDVAAWWASKKRIPTPDRTPFPKLVTKHRAIEDYMCKETCYVCRKKTKGRLCSSCVENRQSAELVLNLKKKLVENKAFSLFSVCNKFCDAQIGDECVSIDCDIYHLRATAASYYDW